MAAAVCVQTNREPLPPPAQPPLHAWRCCRCGLLLMRVFLAPGSQVEIECPRCREHQTRRAA